MKISIITIAYNSAATIEDTIQSVLSQDYPEVEYIIVDGASTDKTLSIVDRYADRIAHFISEPDKGIYDAMNKGVQLATGDVIGILNSDDFYADTRVLSDVASRFGAERTDSAANIDALYADLVYVDREKGDKVVRYWKAGPYRPNSFRRGWMPPHPTFFVRRACYERYGLYSLDLRSAADYELMLRFIHKHGIKLAYLERVITHMRIGGESNVSIKNRIRANQEDRRAWTMNGLRPAWYTLSLKPLSKLGQFVRRRADSQ